MTAERRLAFMVRRPGTDRLAWCAESLPDVAQAITSSSKLSSQLSKNSNVGSEDVFGTTLTQTFTRTEIAEVYRQVAWQACQAWAQGVYSDAKYAAELDTILATGLAVVATRAAQPLAPASKPDGSPADKTKTDAEKVAEAAAKKAKDEEAAKAKAAKCKKTPEAEGCKTPPAAT